MKFLCVLAFLVLAVSATVSFNREDRISSVQDVCKRSGGTYKCVFAGRDGCWCRRKTAFLPSKCYREHDLLWLCEDNKCSCFKKESYQETCWTEGKDWVCPDKGECACVQLE